jgi:hypothetical protein
MAGYTKLFSSIITSSIWQEDNATRIVWITMLATADANGLVEGAVPGLAHIARVDLDECQRALMRLQSPDPYSRTQDFDGRRIEPVPGGWRILNYAYYREKGRTRDRTEYMREYQRQRRRREKQCDNVNQCQPMSTDDNRCNPIAEAEAEANIETASAVSCPDPKKKPSVRPPIGFDYTISQFTGITDDDWQAWDKAFPAVDVRQEALKAALWLRDNPTKRKKNVRRFLTNWFGRVQERGGNHGTGPPPPADIRKALEDFWKKKGKGDE